MVCPEQDDPVLHELLPKLSWNSSLRGYHDTRSFRERFAKSDEHARAALLTGISSNLFFNYQQNNDANTWLYANHRELCEKQGLRFREIQS
jgi:hypothetical protein